MIMSTKWNEMNIDHFIGPSLFNNKWSNYYNKRNNYYDTLNSIVTLSNGHRSNQITTESDIDSDNSSRSNSRSSSRTRSSREGSRHSSLSDQMDPRSLIGVGFIIDAPPTSMNKFERPQSKRERKRRQFVYPNNHPLPMYDYYGGPLCPCSYMIDPYTVNCAFPTARTSTETRIPPPPERRWISMEDVNENRKLATVTTMSYNILSNKYVSSRLYSMLPAWSLSWEYRKKLIFQQLQKYQPDIIALQEVETLQYWMYFKPKLELMGYTGTFSARSRAKTMGHSERQSVDGCALFWKSDKFALHRIHVIEFTQLAIAKADRSEHMLNRVMTRDNIALAAVLKLRHKKCSDFGLDRSGMPLVVCSTHIHWDPEYCDVKLVQTMMLAQELSAIQDQTGLDFNIHVDDVPLLLCGDLNSTEDSSVYEFLTMGSVEADHDDFKDFRGQTCLQKLSSSNFPDIYCHELQLKSAYDRGMLPFTNYANDFKGVIDYIFSSSNMVCEAVLGPQDTKWFKENDVAACPCPYIPSDHIPLVARHGIMLPLDVADDADEWPTLR